MNSFNQPKDSRDFENETHIARKKKAESKKQHVKNYRDLTKYVDNVDTEEFDVDQYVRYIK